MRNSEKNTTFAPAKSLKGLSTVDFGALDERFSLRSAKPARAVRLRHAPQKQRDSIESLFSLTISLRLTLLLMLLLMLSLSSFVIIAGCPAALRYFLRCGHLRLYLTVCLLCRIACMSGNCVHSDDALLLPAVFPAGCSVPHSDQ